MMKLSEAIEALCLATRVDGGSPRTVEAYREKLGHLHGFLGDVLIEDITTADLRRYVADLMDQNTLYAGHPTQREQAGHLSPSTIASRVGHMKRLFNWLAQEGILTANPAARIKRPKIPDQEPKGIEWDDVQALLDTTKGGSRIDLRDRAMICFLADTGCRVRGLCGLQISDVDLENRRAWVMEKGDQGRFVFFLQGTAEALGEWFEKRPQDQGPWAFVSLGNRSKGALLPEGIAKTLRRRAKQAGIEGRVNPHAFRHSFGRHFTLGGGDIGMLSDLLGHSDIGVTKRYYARYNIDELQERHGRYSPMAQLRSCDNDD